MEVNMLVRNSQLFSFSLGGKGLALSLSMALGLLSATFVTDFANSAVSLHNTAVLSPALAAPAIPAAPANAAKQANDKAAAPEKEKDKDKEKDKKEATKPVPELVIENIVNVQPETLVDHPAEYLNKNIRFTAIFSGYNNLAVDYKPAMRSSKNYLSFSVFREHSKVPLSELKLAMVNPKDEKDPLTTLLIKLKEKDEIEVIGKVFNTALDEPWVDVLKLKVIKAAPEDKKADAGSTPSK